MQTETPISGSLDHNTNYSHSTCHTFRYQSDWLTSAVTITFTDYKIYSEHQRAMANSETGDFYTLNNPENTKFELCKLGF